MVETVFMEFILYDISEEMTMSTVMDKKAGFL